MISAAPTLRAVLLAGAGLPVAVALAALRPELWLVGVLWPLIVCVATIVDAVASSINIRPRIVSIPTLALEVGRPGAFEPTLTEVPRGLEAQLETSEWLDAERESQLGESPIFRLRARRRGTRTIEALHLRWRGPMGLAAQVRRLKLDLDVPVTVDLGTVREEALSLAIEGLIGESVRDRRGAGSEFDALRTFTVGMDRRSIDWKHSARHSELLAREMRDEQNQTVAVVIDSGRTMTEPVAEGGLSRLDHGVTSALLTAFVALKRGDGTALFGIDSHPRVKTGVLSGSRSFPAITAAAADIDYSSVETNFTLGLSNVAASLKRRSLVIVFTEIVDPTSAELMVESTARLLKGHLVLFVVFRDGALEAAVEKEPVEPEDISRAVIAGSLLRTRREVFAKLRHLGVDVLEVWPEESPQRVVRRYLDIKKGGLL
ncbi:MAG: DUF58 domain-containing protein [Pseudomonadota bacterium]